MNPSRRPVLTRIVLPSLFAAAIYPLATACAQEPSAGERAQPEHIEPGAEGLRSGQDPQNPAAGEADVATLVAALRQARDLLEAARRDASETLRAISSARSDFQRDSDIARFAPLIAKGGVLAEKVAAVLPDARKAVDAFEKEHPDAYALGKKVPEARDAHTVLDRLKQTPADWDRERALYVGEFLDEAASTLEMYEQQLENVASSPNVMRALATRAETAGLRYAQVMTEAAAAFHPGEAGEVADRVAALRQHIVTFSKTIAKALGDADAAERAQLAGARFPETDYRGGEWVEAAKLIRAAYAKFAPKDAVLKLAVSAPWEKRTEARWHSASGSWHVRTYDYINAWIAARGPGGHVRVHSMSFRKTLLSDGSWSELRQHGVGRSFRMLAENL